MRYSLIEGDCIEVLAGFEAGSVDAIVCDPPYGIGFMGLAFDVEVPGDAFAAAAFRVLKPGSYCLCFSATRTAHRLTVALEDAGFEVRDIIAHVFYSGFPKNLAIDRAIDNAAGVEREVVGHGKSGKNALFGGTQVPAASGARKWARAEIGSGHEITAPTTDAARRWAGFGTALKPAFEPCIVVRKPLEGTYANNVLKHGTGALNIDGCRFAYGDPAWPGPNHDCSHFWDRMQSTSEKGSVTFKGIQSGINLNSYVKQSRFPANIYHCPKPSRAEREAGCEHLKPKSGAEAVKRKEGTAGLDNPRAGAGRTAESVKNYHPTVKPSALMSWLCCLVGGQKGSLIVDPFLGSGSTGIGCLKAGFDFIGIEKEAEYLKIARARIQHASPMFDREVEPRELLGTLQDERDLERLLSL